MTKEDKRYADKLRNKALSDYARLNLAIKALEQQPCEDAISRAEALKHSHIEYDDDGVGHRVVYVEDLKELPTVTPKGVTITDFADKCKECGKNAISREKIKEALEKMERGLQSCFNTVHCESNHGLLEGQERAFKYCIETLKETLDECRAELHGSNEFFNFDSPMAKGENDNES